MKEVKWIGPVPGWPVSKIPVKQTLSCGCVFELSTGTLWPCNKHIDGVLGPFSIKENE